MMSNLNYMYSMVSSFLVGLMMFVGEGVLGDDLSWLGSIVGGFFSLVGRNLNVNRLEVWLLGWVVIRLGFVDGSWNLPLVVLLLIIERLAGGLG